MTETSQYRLLSLEQVTEAISRTLKDERFSDQGQLLQIVLGHARLLELSIQEGIDQETDKDAQKEKTRIASALQFLASRAGVSDIFGYFGITPTSRD